MYSNIYSNTFKINLYGIETIIANTKKFLIIQNKLINRIKLYIVYIIFHGYQYMYIYKKYIL